MSRPVVFLDIDETLNHHAHHRHLRLNGRAAGDHASRIDPACVARVQRICDRTGAVVVISSAWREIVGLEATVTALRACGLTADVIGQTPTEAAVGSRIVLALSRWQEIRAWLDGHPEVDRFVVLDDAADSTPAEVYVRADPATGITDADVERAVAVIGGPR